MSDHRAGEPGSIDSSDAENYSERLISGGSFMTRMSHRRRVDTSLSLLDGQHFERAADVGAADGWFLRALLERSVIAEGLGIDNEPAMVETGRARSAGLPLRFVQPSDATLEAHRGALDLVACMETLEHTEDVDSMLDLVVDLARPGGSILVSVPVEVGPSLLGKQSGRWLANRRGTYGYERYPWRELVRVSLLWNTDGVTRQNLYSHKGFDFRRIRRMLAARAEIVRTVYSPAGRLGPAVASTVFWIARKPG